jgi:competence protein ComEC
MRRPLLVLAGLFGAGCLLVDGEAGSREPLVLLLLAVHLLGLALAARQGRGAGVALGAAALALGVAAAEVEGLQFEAGTLRRRLLGGEAEGRPLRIVGTVRGDAAEEAGWLGFAIDAEAVEVGGRLERADGRVRVEVGGDARKPRLLDGDRVAVWASLRPLPGVRSAREGLAAAGTCKSARLLERRDGSGAGPARRAAARAREAARRLIVRSMLPGTERGLVLAMALGDRSEIDEATAEAFRASGTYHVLALSGAQVALVALLIVAVLRRAGAGPWAQATLTAAAISLYALLVGGDVPVVRAAVMASAVLVGRALELDADASNLLGLAALVLLALRPAAAADVGFQLSFGATLGILALAGPLTRGVPRLPLRADLAVAASVAAQCALGPVLTARFHRLAPAAVLLNLAAVPLSSAVLLAGLAVLVLAPLGPVPARMAGDVAWIAARALRASGDLGPLGPWLDLRVPGPSFAAVALYAAGLGLLYRERRRAGLALLAACQLTLAAGGESSPVDGRLHLAVIDVGQGDGLLLLSPSGRAILVDAGGSRDPRFDPGERRVAPELWRRGVRRIDALLVTHAHPDHVGGAPFVLKAFRVAELWEGLAPLHDPVWGRVEARLAAARPTGRRSVAAGATLEWDGVRIDVLGPLPPARPPLRVRNEDSVVLGVTFGEVRLLLTGDVAGEAEDALRVPRSVVVKVPHHGSRSSSRAAFVSQAAPRLAVVSVGAHNPFGHPHPEVLERYRRSGALVLRTDRDGNVDVATDGRRVWVRVAGEGEGRRVQ